MTLPCPQKSTFTIRQVTVCLIGSLPLLGVVGCASGPKKLAVCNGHHLRDVNIYGSVLPGSPVPATTAPRAAPPIPPRSEEHTSELQSLMRISYAVFCLKKKKHYYHHAAHTHTTLTQ